MIDVGDVLARTHALRAMSRDEEAINVLGTALTQEPHDSQLLSQMALLLFDVRKDLPAANAAVSQAIAADPASAHAWIVRTYVCAASADMDHAIAAANEAVRLAPENSDSHLALAIASVSMTSRSSRTQSRAALARAVELSPHDPDLYATAAQLERLMNGTGAANEYVSSGLALAPTDPALLTMRGESASQPQRHAIELLRGVLEQQPSHVAARRAMSNLMWNALSRLASGVWMFAFVVVVLSIWVGPNVLSTIRVVLFVPIIIMWIGVFRRLRRRLPNGYFRRRILARPEACAGLLFAAVAGLTADLAAVVLTTAGSSAATRDAYLTMLFACWVAGCAHLLLHVGRVRPVQNEKVSGRTETDPGSHAGEVDTHALSVVILAAPVLLISWPLTRWSPQPGALLAAVAVVASIVTSLAVETWVITLLYARHSWRSRMVGTVLLIMSGSVLLLSLHAIGNRDFKFMQSTQSPLIPTPVHIQPIPAFPTPTESGHP